jgi:serine/threonine protein phosphatase PrpC
MNISLSKIYDKGIGDFNEDDFLIKENLFAVFDGASSLVKFRNEKGETGAKIAAKIAKNVFSKNGKTLRQLALETNDVIYREMKRYNINTIMKEERWSTSLAAVRIEKGKVEYLTIGDCLILFIYNNGSHRLLVPYHDHDLETMKKWKTLADKKVQSIQDELKEQTVKVRRETNIKYGALNGEKDAIRFLNIGYIDLKGVNSIILFTDGLLIPKEGPEDPEDWDLFIQLYQKSGLKGILKHVRSLEKTDPNCWKYPRFKIHDDVAAIRIGFL